MTLVACSGAGTRCASTLSLGRMGLKDNSYRKRPGQVAGPTEGSLRPAYPIAVEEPLVEAVAGIPAPPLRSIIGRYHGYRTLGPPSIHRGLPSSRLTFIISLDEPVDIARMPEEIQAPGEFQAFVAGLHDTPASIRHSGYQYGISVELTPFAARRLLGMPAGELAYSVVPLEELLGHPVSGLVDRLVMAPGWGERFATLDDFLVARLREDGGPAREVAWVWEQILAAGGVIEVSQLAAEVGYSRRHLGELFHRELGLAPKTAARVARFERSRHLLAAHSPMGLVAVAAGAGYFDQAHMAREWSTIAGCSPSVWMAEELPFVQDDPLELGAS
jgi:AraC-like DNA-binding protein